MIKIKINNIEVSLLVDLLSPQLNSLLIYKNEGSSYIIESSKEIFEKILNELSDVLSEKGFDADFEPNQLGRKIENLIDKFTENLYD